MPVAKLRLLVAGHPVSGPSINDAQARAIVAIIESGTIPTIHKVVRRQLTDVAQRLHAEFAVSLCETTEGRELKKLCYVNLTAGPCHHAQDIEALEAF
jgi:dTDP-4-amino-4,6-dideoxygalactose transaminase